MARKPRAEVEITGKDTTGKAFGTATQKLKAFAKNAAASLARIATASTAIVAGTVVAAKALLDIGSNVAETQSKFDAVFKASSESLSEFGEDFRAVAGLTRTETQAILANAGAIAQGLGFTTEASAALSEQVVTLAGDLGSFNNLPTDAVAATVSKALTGETESLKALGIVVKQSDIAERALIQTGKKLASELTNQEKATATLALITERAGAAIGDLERTQSGAANQARQVGAELRQLRDDFATALLPAIAATLPAVSDFIALLGKAADQVILLSTTVTDFFKITNSLAEIDIANTARLFEKSEDLERAASSRRRERLALEIELAEAGFFERRKLRNEIETLLLAEEGISQIASQRRREEEALADSIRLRAEEERKARVATQEQEAMDISLDERLTQPLQLAIVEGIQLTGLENLPGQLDIAAQAFIPLIDNVVGFADAMTALTTDTLVNFANGFVETFEAIGAGDAVFASLSKSIKRSIAESATAQARVQVAEGVAKLAAGIFPPNPAAFISAGKHFAAAALFGAAAGAIGGTRQAVPGGGGVGGRGPISDQSIQQVQGIGTLPPAQIIIQGSLLDMSDPKQSDAFAKALSDLSGRRITVEGI